ncbi:MAG: polysaccharide biosynthesis tyrosine autokinase [Gloeobacteraceae cyanobacterium ES-bin-144]|nr:polysaccharide biosynthesis tyrosine autokinase [Verrucomicrobiales bacterium]
MSFNKQTGRELSVREAKVPALASADPTYFLPKVESGRLIGMLLRRSWMIVIPVIIGAAVMLWIVNQMPKSYMAYGSVYVSSEAPVVLAIRAVAPEETKDLEQMRSVEQGLSASTLLMRVIEKNRLSEDPTFASAKSGPQARLAALTKRVHVELRRGTRIIDISVEDGTPQRAKRLVESLVEEYEDWTTERQQAITRQASEGLAREEVRLSDRMKESAKKLQEFRETHPVPGLEGSEGAGVVRDTLGTLNAQLNQATAERLRFEAEYEAYVKFDSSNPAALAGIEKTDRGSEVLAQVRALQLREADFVRIKERYLFKHPVYKEMASEIETLQSNLATTVRSAGQALEQRYRIAKDNELKLAASVSEARVTAVESEGVREQFRAMTREAEADRNLHDSVALRLRETNLAASVPASVLRWQDTPMVPESPHGPKKLVFAAVGAFAGFLVGLALLIVAELSDRKVRNPTAASRAIGSPLLVAVPAIENPGDGMVLMSDPASAGAEAFRRLRVVLAPQPGSNTGRTVLFLSAKAGEGKSFCALNYATSLAMQGHRTLLLDADMRTAGLSRDFVSGDSEASGLGGYLDGKIEPSSACFATSLPNLYVISSGRMRGDAAELLAGTRFPSLLEDAYRWFDRVVIDAPPVLAVSDALVISRYADRCCMVVREGGGDRRELRRAADLVRSSGGNLVGFVWNESLKQARNSSSVGPAVPVNRPGLGAPQPVGSASANLHPLTIVSTFG